MKRGVIVGLVIAAGLAVAPVIADADGRRHEHGGGQRLHRVLPHHLGHQRFFHGTRTVIVGIPLIAYGSSVPVYATPEYVPPPPAYPPVYAPPAYAPAPVYTPSPAYAPSPLQTVIEFSTGRYVLQGDGVSTPYRWVWIPNPPASPPTEEPAAPSTAPSPSPPPRRADIYRWTDADGVIHLTDRFEKVPEAYRSKATKSQS